MTTYLDIQSEKSFARLSMNSAVPTNQHFISTLKASFPVNCSFQKHSLTNKQYDKKIICILGKKSELKIIKSTTSVLLTRYTCAYFLNLIPVQLGRFSCICNWKNKNTQPNSKTWQIPKHLFSSIVLSTENTTLWYVYRQNNVACCHYNAMFYSTVTSPPTLDYS